jgi:hypothetical protein
MRCSWSARSTLAWVLRLMSAISSRNSVPPSARRTSPSRSSRAPENAPRFAPNSSLSISVRGSAPQFTATKAPRRPDSSWIARAVSSLPVPVSPRISTGTVEGAILTREPTRYSTSRLIVRSAAGSAAVDAMSRSAASRHPRPSSRYISITAPSSITSPSTSTARLAGAPLIVVPFFEPRSTSSQPSAVRASRTCWREISKSPICSSSARPDFVHDRGAPRPIVTSSSSVSISRTAGERGFRPSNTRSRRGISRSPSESPPWSGARLTV